MSTPLHSSTSLPVFHKLRAIASLARKDTPEAVDGEAVAAEALEARAQRLPPSFHCICSNLWPSFNDDNWEAESHQFIMQRVAHPLNDWNREHDQSLDGL
mmetsp:Transcript_117377/g.284732  ORF Transcript_117377/g.284732 Transcript_117377/m.284732 type:complete len:100 (+) Transcript_117377:152-451(+)